MKLYRIVDLVGKSVKGLKADCRSRNASGQLKYDHYEGDDEFYLRTMETVRWKKRDGHKWLLWEWKKDHKKDQWDCGYSGIRQDGDYLEYYILIEPIR